MEYKIPTNQVLNQKLTFNNWSNFQKYSIYVKCKYIMHRKKESQVAPFEIE